MPWAHREVFWKLWTHSYPAFQTRENWFFSSRAKSYPNGRDRKSLCSFIDSSKCWLGFYRRFPHYKDSHYKNCKIKGKLQIRCCVFITELIETQSKHNLWWKPPPTSGKTNSLFSHSPNHSWLLRPSHTQTLTLHSESGEWIRNHLMFISYSKTMMIGCWFVEYLRKFVWGTSLSGEGQHSQQSNLLGDLSTPCLLKKLDKFMCDSNGREDREQ